MQHDVSAGLRLLSLLSISFLISCGTGKDTASSVKFEPATLDDHMLINRVHNQRIEVCVGDYANLTANPQLRAEVHQKIEQAIQGWLDPLRQGFPNTHFAKSIAFACSRRPDLVASIGIDIYPPIANDTSRAYCTIGSYETPHCRIRAHDPFGVYLHEIGHAFGMLDTYVEGSWGPKEGQVVATMNESSLGYLTDDDKAGIRFLFCQYNPGHCRERGSADMWLPDGFYAAPYIHHGSRNEDYVADKYIGQPLYRIQGGTMCHIVDTEQAIRFGAWGHVRKFWSFDLSKGIRAGGPHVDCSN